MEASKAPQSGNHLFDVRRTDFEGTKGEIRTQNSLEPKHRLLLKQFIGCFCGQHCRERV